MAELDTAYGGGTTAEPARNTVAALTGLREYAAYDFNAARGFRVNAGDRLHAAWVYELAWNWPSWDWVAVESQRLGEAGDPPKRPRDYFDSVRKGFDTLLREAHEAPERLAYAVVIDRVREAIEHIATARQRVREAFMVCLPAALEQVAQWELAIAKARRSAVDHRALERALPEQALAAFDACLADVRAALREPPYLPDLVVETVEFGPPGAEDAVDIITVVRNVGIRPARAPGGIDLDFFWQNPATAPDAGQFLDRSIGTLQPLESAVIGLQRRLPVRRPLADTAITIDRLRVTVDPQDRVEEPPDDQPNSLVVALPDGPPPMVRSLRLLSILGGAEVQEVDFGESFAAEIVLELTPAERRLAMQLSVDGDPTVYDMEAERRYRAFYSRGISLSLVQLPGRAVGMPGVITSTSVPLRGRLELPGHVVRAFGGERIRLQLAPDAPVRYSGEPLVGTVRVKPYRRLTVRRLPEVCTSWRCNNRFVFRVRGLSSDRLSGMKLYFTGFDGAEQVAAVGAALPIVNQDTSVTVPPGTFTFTGAMPRIVSLNHLVRTPGMELLVPDPDAMRFGERYRLEVCGSGRSKLAWRAAVDVLTEAGSTLTLESPRVELDEVMFDLLVGGISDFAAGAARPPEPQPRRLVFDGDNCYRTRPFQLDVVDRKRARLPNTPAVHVPLPEVAGVDTLTIPGYDMRVELRVDPTREHHRFPRSKEYLRCNPEEIYIESIRIALKGESFMERTPLYLQPANALPPRMLSLLSVIDASDTAQVQVRIRVPPVYLQQASRERRRDGTRAVPAERPNDPLETCQASLRMNFPTPARPGGQDSDFLVGVPAGFHAAGGVMGGGTLFDWNGMVRWRAPLPTPPAPPGFYIGTITLTIDLSRVGSSPLRYTQRITVRVVP